MDEDLFTDQDSGSETLSGTEAESDSDLETITFPKPLWKPTILRRTQLQDDQDNFKKMDNSLKGIQLIKPRLYIKKPYQELSKKVLLVIDIAAISGIAFHYNMKRADNKAFNTSFYEIDHILE